MLHYPSNVAALQLQCAVKHIQAPTPPLLLEAAARSRHRLDRATCCLAKATLSAFEAEGPAAGTSNNHSSNSSLVGANLNSKRNVQEVCT